MRIHDFICKDCGAEFEKITKVRSGSEAAEQIECIDCGGKVSYVLKYTGAIHCFNGPYIDSQSQQPFQTKTAMIESIKRRGLEIAS